VKIVDSQGKEVQKVSARDMVRFLTEHMEEHVGVIEAIKEKYGV
jgi:hypothetical protein